MSLNHNTTTDPTMNPSMYFLHPSETSQKLVNEVFTGSSYSDWKRTMIIALSTRNKMCFVNGTLVKPHVASPKFKAWERVNNVVLG